MEEKEANYTVTDARKGYDGGCCEKRVGVNPTNIDYDAVAKELRNIICIYGTPELTLNNANKILDRMMSSFIGGMGG